MEIVLLIGDSKVKKVMLGESDFFSLSSTHFSGNNEVLQGSCRMNE
jgi:hypothetical protein